MQRVSPYPRNGPARRAFEKVAVMGLRGLIIVVIGSVTGDWLS